MNCFLLAAGKGTRLKPITNTIPKCLVPINNKPLLSYWFDLFEFYKIEEVLINVHYLPDKVIEFVNKYKGNLKITTIFEKDLLGSFGTLVQNIEKYKNEDSLFVCYADNLTNFNIKEFIFFHNSHDKPVTVGLFTTPFPKQCGIIELDIESNIISFEEKPENPKSNLANAGIYMIDVSEISKYKMGNRILDIAFDFLPNYINNMKGYLTNEFLYDIGDVKKLKFAETYVKENIDEFKYLYLE